MIKKKGVSAVVATVLIIMITVAAVGLIWGAVMPLVRNNLDSSLEGDIELSIDVSQGYTVWDEDSGAVEVHVRRGNDDLELTGISFIFGFAGSSKTYNRSNIPEKNKAKVYTFSGFSSSPNSVRVAPIIKGKVKKYVSEIGGGSGSSGSSSGGGVLPEGDIPPAECDSELRYREFLCLSDVQAYWPFNEDTQFNDTSGNERHGMNYSDAHIGEGALVLDGDGDHIQLGPSFLNGTDNVSLSAWINVKNHTYRGGIIGNYNWYHGRAWLYVVGDNSADKKGKIGLNSFFEDNSPPHDHDYYTYGSYVGDGAWYYVVGVYDRTGNQKIYVDGVLKSSRSIASASNFEWNDLDLLIGSLNGGSYFNGSIDEVLVLNRTLTELEIEEIYSLGRG